MWTNRTDHTFGGKLGDTVIFGAQAEGAPTTIDLQGQYAIDHLIVTNGAPAYVFGTSDAATQSSTSRTGVARRRMSTASATSRP